jgi:hypothetical protein
VTVPVQFSVDTSIPFGATSQTPLYSNTTTFDLRVETNKRAFCYFGETADTILNCMGACDYGHAHVHPTETTVDGNNTWYIKCSTGAGDEVATLVIPVVVDTTPPEMEYVDDTSNIINDPEYSYFTDQLQLDFLGFENESGIKAYYYRVTTFFSNETVLNWTLSTTGGTPFMVTGLNLTDGNRYKAEAYAVNWVGLQSEPMSSACRWRARTARRTRAKPRSTVAARAAAALKARPAQLTPTATRATAGTASARFPHATTASRTRTKPTSTAAEASAWRAARTRPACKTPTARRTAAISACAARLTRAPTAC